MRVVDTDGQLVKKDPEDYVVHIGSAIGSAIVVDADICNCHSCNVSIWSKSHLRCWMQMSSACIVHASISSHKSQAPVLRDLSKSSLIFQASYVVCRALKLAWQR